MIDVIFLDIDGVMRTPKSDELWAQILGLPVPTKIIERRLSVRAICNLNYILSYSGAKVVISSTWREILTLPQLRDHFKSCGFTGEIIGVTPILGNRGEEILFYLKTNPVVNWVVVDDKVHKILPHIDPNKIIKCDSNLGLEDDSLVNLILGSITKKEVNSSLY